MGIFNFFNRNKNIEERRSSNVISEMFVNNKVYISDKVVEKLPSVYEGINKISAQIAQIPLYLNRDKGNSSIEKVSNDYRNFLINRESSSFDISFKLKYNMVRDLLLYGKSYNYVKKVRGKIDGIHHIDYKTVTVKEFIDDDGVVMDIDYSFILNKKNVTKNYTDMLIVDYNDTGILNSSSLLELMIDHDNALKHGLENAARPSGLLKTENTLTEPTIQKLKASWDSLYSGGENAGKTVVLEQGLDFKSIDVDLSSLQMIDMKKEFTNDVMRLFGLYDVKSDEEFLKRTLNPLINAIESSLNKYLLTEREKEQNYFFRADCSELLRPSTGELYSIMGEAVKSGVMTVNECRGMLDLPKFFNDEDGDRLTTTLGSVLLDKDYNATVLNLGKTISNEDKPTIEEDAEADIVKQ